METADSANPYESPVEQAAESSPPSDASRQLAIKRIRLSATIGVLPLLYEYGRFMWEGMQQRRWEGELGGFFVIEATFGGLALLVAFGVAWLLLYPAIQLVSVVVHYVVGRTVPAEKWRCTTDEALWTLPYCATAASLTWMVYSIGVTELHLFRGVGRWFDRLLFGVGFHVIGAWFYLTLFVAWLKVRRESSAP